MDRRWMAVRPDGAFLTQRECPELARVRPELKADALVLRFGDSEERLEVARGADGSGVVEVGIWGELVEAVRIDRVADRWLSRRLGEEVRLVYMPDSALRTLETEDSGDRRALSFVDSHPFLLIGRGSLRELNRRLENPVRMHRFRPNIVVDGVAPFAEDDWERIRIGAIEFGVEGVCTRCSVTTVDQRTGERGEEPLRELARFRRTEEGEVAFGQYLVHRGEGELCVGDEIEVLD